jgi:hypothetical protein
MHSLRRLHIDVVSKDLDRALDAFMRDPRLLPLRMAHRLNDIRHLDRFSKRTQRTLAREAGLYQSRVAEHLSPCERAYAVYITVADEPHFVLTLPKANV